MTLRYESADAGLPFAQRLAALAAAASALAARALPLFNKGDGPPDLDELWRDFNRKLGGLFGGKNGQRPSNNGNNNGPTQGGGNGGGGGFQPDMKGPASVSA